MGVDWARGEPSGSMESQRPVLQSRLISSTVRGQVQDSDRQKYLFWEKTFLFFTLDSMPFCRHLGHLFGIFESDNRLGLTADAAAITGTLLKIHVIQN